MQSDDDEITEPGCYTRTAEKAQRGCYQFLAWTSIYNLFVSCFTPGHEEAIQTLDVQPDERVLFVGVGDGAGFQYLSEQATPTNIFGCDVSSQMIKKCKLKAATYGIPAENIVVGDAQAMSYAAGTTFNKIFFPLSLASIPDPARALLEAEQLLAPHGTIVVYEKLVDEGVTPSKGRRCFNVLTQCIFADVTRDMPTMLGSDSPLAVTAYNPLTARLKGCARPMGRHYRIVELQRRSEQAPEYTPPVLAIQ